MEIINTDFENWGSYLMKQFQIMYEKGERCDLEINCNKQIFLVHRLIMSACSDYVRDLGEKQHIILPEEVSCKTLKTVIEFVYSGKIIFHKEDKEDLLIAASLLNMRLLIELIKREDPSSYTISMDDDKDENHDSELINCGVVVEEGRVSSSDNYSEQKVNPNYNQMTSKRKSYSKPYRNKSPKKNCVVLPPLHKFPYLQQKFSGTRTYGLITNLTSAVPSRFEISDVELETSSYRSTFHDVTYDTQRLLSDPDSLKLSESAHLQFLKKLKDTPGHRRNYSNALYSPFDKYTPPCNLKLSDSFNSRRPEAVVSYPSNTDATSTVRKYPVNNFVHSKGNSSARKTAAPSSPSLSVPKEYKRSDQTKTNRPSSSVSNTIEKRVRFSDSVDVREIDVPFMDTDTSDFEILPEPIMPSAIMENVTSLSDSGDKVELIKLNNVVVPSSLAIDERSSFVAHEESADVSISVIQTNNCEIDDILSKPSSDSTIAESMDVEESQSVCETPITLETGTSTEAVSNDTANVTRVHDDLNGIDGGDDILDESNAESCDLVNNSSNNNEVEAVENASKSTTSLKPLTSSVVGSISTDTTLFTPLNTNTNSTQISTELNSQIFALKVKGSDSPAQLDKLVDLCKNNPLFKNKNIRFKIVPVKGTIPEKLKGSALMSSGINKAIIVKRTENLASAAISNISPTATTVSSKPVEITKRSPHSEDTSVSLKKDRTASIENVNGPWSCTNCGAAPLTFSSYYEYRTHLHSVHKEPNNPVHCMHCGYKSLKRNMQLYHLFVKHNVPPPSHIKFPKCDKCEFHALNEYYLQKHLVCHPSVGMEYVCSCKVAFKSSELLQKHMVSGDCKDLKSFKCGYCHCFFDRFVNLKAHMRVCMKERSKPMLENSISSSNLERPGRNISDGG